MGVGYCDSVRLALGLDARNGGWPIRRVLLRPRVTWSQGLRRHASRACLHRIHVHQVHERVDGFRLARTAVAGGAGVCSIGSGHLVQREDMMEATAVMTIVQKPMSTAIDRCDICGVMTAVSRHKVSAHFDEGKTFFTASIKLCEACEGDIKWQ